MDFSTVDFSYCLLIAMVAAGVVYMMGFSWTYENGSLYLRQGFRTSEIPLKKIRAVGLRDAERHEKAGPEVTEEFKNRINWFLPGPFLEVVHIHHEEGVSCIWFASLSISRDFIGSMDQYMREANKAI